MIELTKVKQQDSPAWLQELAASGVLPKKLPLKDLLPDSVYYPASSVDGYPIKSFSHYSASYVYADYGVSRKFYFEQLKERSLAGYEIFLEREVTKEELVSSRWRPPMPRGSEGSLKLLDERQKEAVDSGLFGHWIIWKRKKHYRRDHGPEYISFLFIGGEGVAVYHGLYVENHIAPLFLVLIQSDAGMARNWTHFGDGNGFMHRVVTGNPAGMPEYFVYGMYGDFYGPCPWPDYTKLLHKTDLSRIDKKRTGYRSPYRQVSVWSK